MYPKLLTNNPHSFFFSITQDVYKKTYTSSSRSSRLVAKENAAVMQVNTLPHGRKRARLEGEEGEKAGDGDIEGEST